MKGLYILAADSFERIYGISEQDDISSLIDIYAPACTPQEVQENPDILADMEVMFSGWGGPRIDEEFLAVAKNLKMVFYGSGSVRPIVTEAFWQRGCRITSAYAANAIPVAEYILSQILFCLKLGWRHVRTMRNTQKPRFHVPGAFGSTVGILSLGMIGRRVCRHLSGFDLTVKAYDPYANKDDAETLGVQLCTLDEIFKNCDVVACCTPWLKETEGMLTGDHFSAMKPDASFINAARGAVVCEKEMTDVLSQRPDLTAVLDVTWPEPPALDSPLRTMDNVVLTPHIAGSMDNECHRMGRYMVDELKRYLAGQPLQWEITQEQASVMA